MDMPIQTYWGDRSRYNDILRRIDEIGASLDANAPTDDEGAQLSSETFELLRPLKLSHVMVSRELGGDQMRPSEVLKLLERVTYWSGSAGWVSMVHCVIGGMVGAFLPDSAVSRLFSSGTENRFSGQAAPTGMLRKVDGGYRLTGKWSYGSGFSYATYSHSACMLDDGTGKPAKDDSGNPVIMCAHAPISAHTQQGNWDVLGLRASGSIDYSADDVFVDEDMVFPIVTAPPQRLQQFFSIGPIGIAGLGHAGWAMGAGRRILDEISSFARTKSGRAGLVGESEKFWYDYGRAEASYRAARAFVLEVCAEIESAAEAGDAMTTRHVSLLHLAKSQIHEVGADVANFAYRVSGGAGLRAGTLQRLFRDMMVAVNHFTIAPSIVTSAGREVGGLWNERKWRFYDLV